MNISSKARRIASDGLLVAVLIGGLILGGAAACKPGSSENDNKQRAEGESTSQNTEKDSAEEEQAAQDKEQNGRGQSAKTENGDENEGTPEWDRPRFDERRKERHRMVRQHIAGEGINDPEVLAGMRHVPRHKFVPERHADDAYENHPLPIGHGQTISQPYVVAFMTELLQIEAGDKVLEIGTGSAYQAAVLSELTPHVFTIEIIEELAESATSTLKELGYKTVKVKTGDGYFGWEKHAPFDAIIVTAAAGHVPPPLLKQLEPGGRMIIPVGGVYEVQYLVLIKKDNEGKTTSEQLLPVRFVPMTGRAREGQ